MQKPPQSSFCIIRDDLGKRRMQIFEIKQLVLNCPGGEPYHVKKNRLGIVVPY